LKQQKEKMERDHAQAVADLKREEVQDANAIKLAQEKFAKQVENAELNAKKNLQQEKAQGERRQAQADKDAQLTAVVQSCETDLRRLRQEQRGRPPPRVHFEELRSSGADAVEYFAVKDRTEKYAAGQHGINMTVTKIERVVSSSLHAKWLEAKMDLHDPSKPHMELFHGTSVDGVKGICENGFRLPDRSEDNMYGQGAYFATDSSKSAQNLYTKGSNRIMLCDVLLGKACEVPCLLGHYPLSKHRRTSSKGRPYLDVNREKVRAADFDSVFAKRGGSMSSGGVANDEFIVYDPRQALPRYVVHFGGAGSTGAVPAAGPGQSVGGGVVKHVLKPQGSSVVMNQESIHYNQAAAQFAQMLGSQGRTVKSVDWYENPAVEARFESCKGKLKHKKEVWVFHGTPNSSVVPKIMAEGFKVGGEEVSIANGAAYGKGVYTATGPDTPMGYAQNTSCVVLARALKGHHGGRTGGDSWTPQGDWLIFKAKEQLLPCYVVHY
jgi:hypothetical protein